MKHLSLILLLTIGSLISQVASAQLLQVDQTVYGMDCAPCAYGMERSFNKMDGLEKVRVSLNEGKAYLDLSETNRVTLYAIQEKVKEGGFTAKKAEIVLKGKAEKQVDEWVITQNEEIFRVTQATEDGLMASYNPEKRSKYVGQ